MEDLMKRPVSQQQADFNHVEIGNDSRRTEAPPFFNQSEAAVPASSSTLDLPSLPAAENSHASDFALHSPQGKWEPVMHLLYLILLSSVLYCSR